MNIAILLSLAGGLGLFLFGMSAMSEGIEKVAGAKLRRILEIFTTNSVTGIVVGTLFTGIIQSSSACTVMVVSFVNSGLMNLYQAAGVVFGANIGTTVTALLVSFKLEKVAPIILLTGVLMMQFSKRQMVNKIGEIITGFGILFTGLSALSEAMAQLQESPAVMGMFASLQSPLLAILLGLVITSVIQSSSVTISIMVLLANQNLVGLDMCMYVSLGANIGACMPAVLASLTGKKDAKRAASIHVIYNVIGTVLIYILLKLAMDPVLNLFRAMVGDNPGRIVAVSNMIFKTAEVIILTPFIKQIVALTHMLIRGDDQVVGYRESYQLQFIGDKVVFNPATAVVEVINEIERMAELASENLNRAMNALITLDEDDIEEVYEVEKNINFLNHSITNYLVKINQTPLPIEDLKSIGALFHVVNDIERIGDHAENVADDAKRRIETGVVFSKDAQKELGEMLDMVNTMIQYSIAMFAKGDESHMADILALEDQVDEKERILQQRHVDRLTKNECSPEAGMIFSDIVSGLERVSDHATNIAFAIINSDKDPLEENQELDR